MNPIHFPQTNKQFNHKPPQATPANKNVIPREAWFQQIDARVRDAKRKGWASLEHYNPLDKTSQIEKLTLFMQQVFPKTISYMVTSPENYSTLEEYLNLKFSSSKDLAIYGKYQYRIQHLRSFSARGISIDPRFKDQQGPPRIVMMTISEGMKNIRDIENMEGSEVVKQVVEDIIHDVYNKNNLIRLNLLLQQSTFRFKNQPTAKAYDQLSPYEKKDVAYFHAVANGVEEEYRMLGKKKRIDSSDVPPAEKFPQRTLPDHNSFFLETTAAATPDFSAKIAAAEASVKVAVAEATKKKLDEHPDEDIDALVSDTIAVIAMPPEELQQKFSGFKLAKEYSVIRLERLSKLDKIQTMIIQLSRKQISISPFFKIQQSQMSISEAIKELKNFDLLYGNEIIKSALDDLIKGKLSSDSFQKLNAFLNETNSAFSDESQTKRYEEFSPQQKKEIAIFHAIAKAVKEIYENKLNDLKF